MLLTTLREMDIPSLPTPIRRSPINNAANLAEAVLVRWSRQFRMVESATRLTAERLELLSVLDRSGEMLAGDLAEELGVSRPAITRMLNGLEQDGLIKRAANPLDGRSIIPRVTPAGRRALARGRSGRVRVMANRLRGRSERELAQLETGLRLLAELLDD
jgi:DNA-binding MarR family transcriptional regulator